MLLNNETLVSKAPVGAVSTAMRIATKVAPTSLLALAALLFAPQAALADNECELVGVDPSVNGATADSYDCDQASYPDGVTYTADGDLTVEFTLGTVTEIEAGGIDLSATGGDSIFFDSASTSTELESRETVGALLGVTTVDGDIDIDTEEMDADGQTPNDVSHAIFAQSTGTGSIDITTTGFVDVRGSNPADSIGIEALTDSGDITVTAQGRVNANNDGAGIRAVSSSGDVAVTVNDNLFSNTIGVQAQTGGSGTLDITVAASMDRLEVTTGTGLMTINVDDGRIDGGGTNEGAVLANAGGDILINNDGTVTSGAIEDGMGMNLTAAGDITINNDGRISSGQNSGFFAIQVSGANSVTLNNNGLIGSGLASSNNVSGGALNFSNLSNGYTFNNNGLWRLATGRLNPQDASFLGAGAINNAGTIDFGERESIIQAQGATFNGLEGSTFDMEITLSRVGQTSCNNAVVAGCLDLTGGTTTGQTSILVSTVAPPLDPEGGLTPEVNAEGILLVDVSGGTSAPEHFVLDPGSVKPVDTDGNGFPDVEIPIYAEDPIYGAVLEIGGPLAYALLYNPDTQQHLLSSVPTQEGVAYAAFNQEVLSVWHTTADAVVGRQADLREGAARGGWIRVVEHSSERKSTPTLTQQSNTFNYQQDYDLDISAVMIGSDVFLGEDYVIGVHTGLLRSELAFDDFSNRDRIKGVAAGVYGGWWQDLGPGQLTLDGTVNANFLRLQHKNSFNNTDTDVRTLGIRAEIGWRLPVVGETFYVQPLATAAYARANFEKLTFSLNNLRFEEADSERAALGVRLSGDMDLTTGNRFTHLRYWLTARAWEENAEDGSVGYTAAREGGGAPLSINDDISESFEEVNLGVSLTSPDNDLNVFLSGGLQSGDQTDSTNVTIGARLRW